MSVFTFAEDKEANRKRTCVAAVKIFLDHIYQVERDRRGPATPNMSELYERLGSQYLQDTGRNHVKDLISFKKSVSLAPRTARAYLGIIKIFLEENGILLSSKQKAQLKKEFRGGDEAPDDPPDHMQIRSFLEHSDVRMKAITLLLSSSGMRIGELLSISEDSINYSRRMITLKADATKTKTGRVVFFSREAETALRRFLNERKKYIERNNRRALLMRPDTQTKEDARIFGYDPITINRAWRRNLKRANMYLKNGYDRATFHPHTLRQFFSTQMRKNGCPDSIVEVLLGHTPYLATYIRYTPKELEEAYEKYSPILEIGSDDMVRKTVASIAEASTKHAEEITKLQSEKEALEKRLQQVEQARASRIEAMQITDAGMIANTKDPAFIDAVARRMLELQKEKN